MMGGWVRERRGQERVLISLHVDSSAAYVRAREVKLRGGGADKEREKEREKN